MLQELKNLVSLAEGKSRKPRKKSKFFGEVAVGILPISVSTGRILMALRSKRVSGGGTWGTIGGRADKITDLKGEALREFREETGYRGEFVRLMPVFVFQEPDNGKIFKYHNFIGLLQDEFIPKKNWETDQFRWVVYETFLKLGPKHFGLNALLKDPKSWELIYRYSH